MKIDRPNGTLPSANLGTAASQSSKAAETAAAKPAATQVQISAQVQSMSTQAAGKSSSFDAQKVQDIRAAIAEGRFEVNAENVADGLLSTVSDLIRSHQRSA